jgi:hypothetical protein
MNYKLIILFTLLLSNFRASATNDKLYIKFQNGLGLCNVRDKIFVTNTLIIDINRKLQIEASLCGNKAYLPYTDVLYRDLIDYTRNVNIGANYQIKKISYRDNSFNFSIGTGYSSYKYQNVVNGNLIGNGIARGVFYYKKDIASANGIYIKPQIQSRPEKHFEYNLHLYANINGHQNIYGASFALNFFRIKIYEYED